MVKLHFLVRRAPPNIWRLVCEEADWTPQDVETETLENYWRLWKATSPNFGPYRQSVRSTALFLYTKRSSGSR
jgi:hypothetical protein